MDLDRSLITNNYSLYIHIPFCRHRCAYCDFNTYAGQESLIPAYVQALCREIEFVAANSQQEIRLHTVFFGGGTPSLLSPGQFELVLNTIKDNYELTAELEGTVEVNPGSCSSADLQKWRALGINRISFGVQSANQEELRQLERSHDFLDVMEGIARARQAGFSNLNLDLIYGLPGQGMRTWQTTLERVLALQPEHISAYALTLEHGTPFARWTARGLLPVVDADLAADMYEWAGDTLESAGYCQYEISNWSKSGYECRHNLQYWRVLPYLGVGAGAHGYAAGFRYSNVLRIKTYIERLENEHNSVISDHRSLMIDFPFSPAMVSHHRQTYQDDLSDYMISSLRLTREGIPENGFGRRFGRDILDVYGRQIDELVQLDLLERVQADGSELLRLTRRGRLLGNQVFVRFVSP